MSLTRWQPLREMLALRDAMDRLFEDTFTQPLNGTGGTTGVLPMDMIERENEVIVRAAVPGYDPEQLDISIQGDLLTIRGSIEEDNEEGDGDYHMHEYRAGGFQRTVRLPLNVSPDDATAECKNGILTLHLPKAQVDTAKRIRVQGNGQQKQIETNQQQEQSNNGEQDQ